MEPPYGSPEAEKEKHQTSWEPKVPPPKATFTPKK